MTVHYKTSENCLTTLLYSRLNIERKIQKVMSLYNYIPRWVVLLAGGIIAFLISYLFINQNATAQIASAKTIVKNDKRGTITFKSSNLLENFEIKYEGKIEVNEDDTDVESISSGGFLEISKTTFGSKRRIVIESVGRGEVDRRYYEGRRSKPFNPEGQEWLAEILPEIVRSTRIAAESRVNRYYQKGGVDAFIGEVERLKSDYVRVHYFDILVQKDNLSDVELIKILNAAGDEVNSDYYLASLLKKRKEDFFRSERVTQAYFKSMQSISSDYYLATVLKDALKKDNLSADVMQIAVEALDDINSDYYQAVVISSLLKNDELDSRSLSLVLKSTRNINSDYYQSTVLKKALSHKNLSDEAFNTLIDEMSNVSSDYYMATIFGDLLERNLDASTKVKIIQTISSKMSSDYYMATLLGKVFENGDASSPVAEATFKAIEGMDSDYYAYTVIKKAAETRNLDDKGVLALINATKSISSDYYQSAALVNLSDKVNSSSRRELKDAYIEAARNISSDTYYGQALKALDH